MAYGVSVLYLGRRMRAAHPRASPEVSTILASTS